MEIRRERQPNQKERFALNFDLIQEELKKNGFAKRPLKAYEDFGKCLNNLGYEKRQQSSYLSCDVKSVNEIFMDLNICLKKLEWLPKCVNKITATAESAVLNLYPLIRDIMNEKEFLNFENSKGVEKETRAIHFDLGIKLIDKNYTHRSTPYREINKAMYALGFHWQQGSGYVSDTELTPDEFVYTIQELKKKVPKLEKVVKHIDATYLKDVWDMKPFVAGDYESSMENKNINYINENTKEASAEPTIQKKELTEQQLLLLNQKVRHSEASPNSLIGKSFEFQNEVYQINDLQLKEGEAKDIATLQRVSDGQVFQDSDFASTNPLKLNLDQKGKDTQMTKVKMSGEKIKSK